MNSIALWITQGISRWRREGMPLQAGVSLQYIEEVEQVLGFTFPNDFKEFYTTVDGFAEDTMDKNMISLWPVERILKEYMEKNDDDDDFIAFCDFMINSHQIGFMKNEAGIYTSHDQTIPVAETFGTCIQLIYEGSDLLW